MKIKIQASYELTDTYGGEANYSWVRRGEVEATSEREIVRLVKAELGMTNFKGHRKDYGDMLEFRPYGLLQVLFITFRY